MWAIRKSNNLTATIGSVGVLLFHFYCNRALFTFAYFTVGDEKNKRSFSDFLSNKNHRIYSIIYTGVNIRLY